MCDRNRKPLPEAARDTGADVATRVEKIRADEARVGDQIKAPDTRTFYELTVADHKPGLDLNDDKVELGTGWGSVTLDPDEIVERENWQSGDAEAEVHSSMRSKLDELHSLQCLTNPRVDLDEWSNDELLALEIGYGEAGPLSRETIQEQAEERLNSYPLCVEATTTFEIVLGIGGPDQRLLIECDGGPSSQDGDVHPLAYEIRRILYRYSWTGSAEVELTGEDYDVAEAFARRVVPELVE